MKRTESDSTTVAEFELKIPSQFDVKPIASVEMPGGRTAKIYETSYLKETRLPGGEWVEREAKGWRIIVCGKNGLPMQGYSWGSFNSIKSELDIQLALHEYVRVLSKKTRKRTETVEPGDED